MPKTAPWNADWPVLKVYDRDHLARIAMPLGGIGTGTVSLGGRGQLRDWEVMNRPAKGFVPRGARESRLGPFFAVRVARPGKAAIVRALEGPLGAEEFEGHEGAIAANHGWPRFRHATFAAAYPLAQVALADPAVPLRVRLEALNPLIPADADASGIPVAVLRYVFTNATRAPLDVSVCGTLPNFVGADGAHTACAGNVNTFRRGAGICGLALSSRGVPRHDPAWGTLALATTATRGISHRTNWARDAWSHGIDDFWEDFSVDGRLANRPACGAALPVASLCVALRLPAGATRAVTFLITWHFPNRYTWTPSDPKQLRAADRIGNYYTTQYRDAWDVAARTAPRLAALERDTARFVSAFCNSPLPAVVKEAALCNLSTLRSQTCFRTPDGFLFGWEGCGVQSGCCHGSCTHVWNYEHATAFLFGALARGMRTVEFRHATRASDGRMSFRVNLPLARAATFETAAADGQLGCLMKLYREWRLSGDDAFLRRLWPRARRALAFCWMPHGWDGDRDGVMEGCQHNTMDVEYYGPNPQMQGWYLGALRAAEEMARHLGDTALADTCRARFEHGRAWMDRHLFNGAYYEHRLQFPARFADVPHALHMGRNPTRHYQLGAGCLVDQLVGQFTAHVCGLGYLHDPARVRRTLRSILRHNRRGPLHAHFSNMRSYALQDETALLMAAYPHGRPRRPFPYYREVMTGFEYVAAIGMLQEGLVREGLRCMRDIRNRYDGRKRNPFDEAECGHHYARAMASWAAVLTLTGFHFDAGHGTMRIAAARANAEPCFWSTGDAWGTLTQRGRRVTLAVLGGALRLRRLDVTGVGSVSWPTERHFRAGAKAATFGLRTKGASSGSVR